MDFTLLTWTDLFPNLKAICRFLKCEICSLIYIYIYIYKRPQTVTWVGVKLPTLQPNKFMSVSVAGCCLHETCQLYVASQSQVNLEMLGGFKPNLFSIHHKSAVLHSSCFLPFSMSFPVIKRWWSKQREAADSLQ